MQNKEQFKRLIIFLMALFIMGIETLMYAFVWFNCYYEYPKKIPIEYFRRGHWAILAMYTIFLLVFGLIFGGFRVGYLRLMDILISQIISIVLVNSLTYLQLALIGRWKFLTNIQPLLFLTLADIICIILWAFVSRFIYVNVYPPHKMLLIYGQRGYDALMKKMAERKDKYLIDQVVSLSEYDIEVIKKKVAEYEAVVLCDIPSHKRNLLLKHCFDKSVRCYITPKLSDIIVSNATDIYLFDSPLKLTRNSGLNFEQRCIKRLMDIVCSLILLILFSPILIISAIIIKLYDKGSIMYSQKRLTKDAKSFNILKFRSMKENSENDGARLAMQNDSRVTPYGAFLRRLHLDELPQIFNILKGEMSFVGPRPERKEIQDEYEKVIPEFHYRLKVKAGLTGYAQVYGRYNTTPYDKLKLDLTYIENYSIFMDIKLILLTVKVLFSKENTQGVEENQKTAI